MTPFFAASLPAWLKWGFWLSPFTYAEIGISVNEFLSPRWQKVRTKNYILYYTYLCECLLFIFSTGLIVKCYNRAPISEKSWIQLWKKLLLDINWCIIGILDHPEYWIHMCTKIFKG